MAKKVQIKNFNYPLFNYGLIYSLNLYYAAFVLFSMRFVPIQFLKITKSFGYNVFNRV